MPKILVCPRCLDPNCSGQEFLVQYQSPEAIALHKNNPTEYPLKPWIVCRSEVKQLPDDRFTYHIVRGHGEEWDVPAIPILEGTL